MPLLRLLRAVSFGSDVTKARSLRSRLIWQEARRRGILMEQVFVFGRPTEWYRAERGGRSHYFESIPLPRHLPRSGHLWLDDKHLLKERLRQAGIPAPRSFSVTSERAARAAFREIGAPAVVKPSTGSRGRHTTVFIKDPAWLREAFRRAKELNHFVVVEECIAGSVCRATIVAGVLRGFLRAEPPAVWGDGASTVVELIAQKNASRHARVSEVLIRPELSEFISRQGYALSSVLPRGTRLPLLFRTGRLFGGETREMLAAVHPGLRAILEEAARVAEAPVVGFDLIIPDPTAPPQTQRWGIIEGNSLPFIDLHDFALEGAPANVASHIWDLWSG
jgi:D-alanine-D-alanine ligase-like ATP-grasp enzyme